MKPEPVLQLTLTEFDGIIALAKGVKGAKRLVTAGMRAQAESVLQISKGVALPSESNLQPREVCMMCGHVGEAKKKRTAKAKPCCPDCQLPFTRQAPWRNYRGKRRHEACIEKAKQYREEPMKSA